MHFTSVKSLRCRFTNVHHGANSDSALPLPSLSMSVDYLSVHDLKELSKIGASAIVVLV